MATDKNFTTLLTKGMEPASPSFTELVMNRVLAAPAVIQPLVPPRLKRAFLLTFFFFSVLACGMALSMGLPHLTLPISDDGFLTVDTAQKIISFFLVFWLLVGANTWLERKGPFLWRQAG